MQYEALIGTYREDGEILDVEADSEAEAWTKAEAIVKADYVKGCKVWDVRPSVPQVQVWSL